MTTDTSTRSTSLAELMDARIARFDTRTLDWDAMKFQEKVNPDFAGPRCGMSARAPRA